MKKLKLKALELGAEEVLTRAQLKNVLGGRIYPGGGGNFNNCSSGCSGSCATTCNGQAVTGSCSMGREVCSCISAC